MPIIPHKIENFKEALFDFVAGGENFFSKLYVDSVGIPTIGYGHAFFTKDGHKNMEAFRALEENGISLSKEDISIFDQIKDLLSKHPGAKKSSHTIKTIQKLIKKIDLEITKEEAVELYEPIMENKLSIMKKSLGKELYEALKGSKEFIAIADQVYNGGHIFSNVLKPLKEGDRAETWYQLRYHSNGGASRSKGIANRRISETNMFGLSNETVTTKEMKNIEQMMHLHKQNIAFQENAFPVTRKSPSPKPYQGKDSMSEQYKAVKHHFLHPKKNDEEVEILGQGIQKVMPIKHINDVASKEISHSENIFHNKMLEENQDLLDDIEDEIENTEDIQFDNQGKLYFDAVLLSGVKHINSDGVYEDTMFTYSEEEDGLVIAQKENPDNNIFVVDWKDEITQETLGIILDDSPLVKEEVSVLPPTIEEYLNQFTSEVQTTTEEKEKDSGQNSDNTQHETNTKNIDKIDTTDKAQEVISGLSFIQQEDISTNGFERD